MPTKQFYVQTKLDKDAVAQRTLLTVDFTDCPVEVLQHLATQHLTVRLQGAWRKAGSIPQNFTAKVAEYGMGSRMAGPVNLEAAVAALSAEDKKKLLEKLMEEVE